MKRDEAFKEFEETLAKINKQANEAREEARATFREQLEALREQAHEELRSIRVLEQKTKRSRKENKST